jgi:hypothetical protein
MTSFKKSHVLRRLISINGCAALKNLMPANIMIRVPETQTMTEYMPIFLAVLEEGSFASTTSVCTGSGKSTGGLAAVVKPWSACESWQAVLPLMTSVEPASEIEQGFALRLGGTASEI